MEFEVKVTGASLDDVVDHVYDDANDEFTERTLGDAVTKALLDRLAADPRWDALADRLWVLAGKQLKAQAPGFLQQLVADEVTRQLESAAQGAVTRGKPSTRAEAIVATEVTTQLRAQFAPVVEQALTALRGHLNTLTDAAVQDFLNRQRRK